MHYDDEALFEYVEGSSPIAGDIDAHIASCERCSSEVAAHREMIASLGDPVVWADDESDGSLPPGIVSFAAQSRAEEEAAPAVCDAILTGPSSWWAQRFRSVDGAHTAGVVRELLERWRSMVESNPANALQVTALALEIANALDLTAYPCDYVIKLRAQACRDHAFVLSFLGRNPEALEFAGRSARLFEQVPLPEYDLARVDAVKAAILRLMDRADEAVALIRRAADTFLRFGDAARHVNARITEGAILYQRREIREAQAVWSALEHDEALGSVESVRLAHNIALCCTELGEPEKAIEYEQRCIAEFGMLGMETERTRSRWVLGRALAACNRSDDAIAMLRDARSEFEQLDMVGDAGLVALEIAEMLLVRGESAEVPAICRDLVAQFTRAGMASRAITALSFLREAVAIGQGTPSLVRHVHDFLRELPAEQPRMFAPPPLGPGA